ncbi:PucR family transcriptional regulator [Mycolicibacterium mengxianglii]|uniref:PucR family transcriptional regulator n=1 Tax=Mycolicibacterium mengxianglii TaxID=2736649 RepID=UPI0018D064F6|nr:helix-turn-helix domain-containing protein [Mycolicibacterium mengxianglii]
MDQLVPPPRSARAPHGSGVRDEVAEVASALEHRVADISVHVAGVISNDVEFYQATAPAPFSVVASICEAHVRAVLSAIAADEEFDPSVAERVGVDRAREGVPLAVVMEVYRVGFHQMWEAVLHEVDAQEGRTFNGGAALRILTSHVFVAQDIFTSAMAAGYRDEQARRLSRDESERSALIDALLHGRVLERWSLWEVADHLRLPTGGPYVVVATDMTVAGAEPLPGIQSKLRSLDVFSAWRTLPDVQVGIVHLKSEKHFDDVLALLNRVAAARVGVSAQFDELRDTAQALRYARVMLRGQSEPGELVSRFDGSILATAAVSAPEVLAKVVAPTLNSFSEMSEDERDVLFDTFRVWLENDGSLRVAGELLFCHPNTVRYRLHRIEQCTGRSLSRPRDVAEMCLALEVHRRLK